jgi:hypothetical protein
MSAPKTTSLLLLVCGILQCVGADTGGRTNSSPQKVPQIKTIFVDDAKLTDQEVKDVVSLARQCGISEPGEIRTFHYLPTTHRGISVKSVELVQGSDITFDEIHIGNIKWTKSVPDENTKRVADFCATPSEKYTTHLRVYDFRGEQIRVQIWAGITPELADKIIPLIAAKKVRFPDNKGLINSNNEMKMMIDLKPSGISKNDDGGLWLHVSGLLNVVKFRFDNGEIVLEQVIHIVI